jgi:hypothetical protein
VCDDEGSVKTMAQAMREEGRGHLLQPSRPCGFCGIRTAQVGNLCCFCDEDEESREQYAAMMAKKERNE